MRQVPIFAMLLFAATLLVPSATAQVNETFEIEAHDNYFTLAGESAQNATLTVSRGANVTVNLTNVGVQPHDFRITELNVASDLTLAGGSNEVNFTASDEDVTYEYFCSIHPQQMRGQFVIGNGTAADDGDGGNGNGDGNGNGGGDNGTPAPSAMVVVMGLAVLALAFRRRG